MQTFEDIVREEIVDAVMENPPEPLVDKSDIQLWGHAAYAILRAGAIGVGEDEALELGNHFFGDSFRDTDTEKLRNALRDLPRRHLKEAYGLIYYFNLINREGFSPEDATIRTLIELAFNYPPRNV